MPITGQNGNNTNACPDGDASTNCDIAIAVVVINEGNSGGDDTLMVIVVESFTAFNSFVAVHQRATYRLFHV